MMNLNSFDTTEYKQWVNDLKYKIQSAQIKAALSVNREMLYLYWEIGKSIAMKLAESDWGSAVVEKLANDLKK
jgi:hypothetical protein